MISIITRNRWPECWRKVWNDYQALAAAIIMGLLGAAFLSGLIYGVKATTESLRPGITVLASKIINPTITEGEEFLLEIELVSIENRECLGQIVRTFTQMIDVYHDGVLRPVIRRQGAEPPIMHVNGNPKVYYVPVSTVLNGVPLKPGEYEFIGDTGYSCPGLLGKVSHYQTLPRKLTIVPKGNKVE